ncbi:BRCT domain-containing protein [Metarhizium album ARSEF 1941]|uniref:BRCT domain-containing protein n=1 Tax=Metarhizium album (strain ARSEF 1941) TaxID=1081103 RepID=A0A0B2X625_METAS|nr:BRCT domain-containing protein [Metarhizium album ARSEF 1941]KHO01213.1 BRCT domain-containing protein [Metarhizium album ARSEF 1941]
MASSQSADDARYPTDPSAPLKNVVVCCTSIPPDQRTDIAQKVAELGGIHKYDLTPDVTHLIVGDYDTPKYRHVARERPDIKAMDAMWIEAVTELWKNDDEIDFTALEEKHQLRALEKCGADTASPHEGSATGRQALLICLTGFGEQRDEIAARIAANGGRYTGDLTRRCTHLVVSKPEGKKYAAAKSWGVNTVTLGWLDQSIQRGLILEEAKFDPLLPVEEQGVGAWNKEDPRRASLGKRCRPASSNANATDERGVRKLRKTASMKLSSQRKNLWGDILGRSGSGEHSFGSEQAGSEQPTRQQATPEPTIPQPHQQHNNGVFANCVFAIHGFTEKRQAVLEDTIATLGGSVASSLREAASCRQTEQSHCFLVVPQTSRLESHPKMPYDGVETITEFYVERCLHNKQFLSPGEHVLGRPFPLFPIPDFSHLVICSAAFTGLELNQVARSVSQLGAKFEEEFRRTTSVLVCKSLRAMRRDKLKYALAWGVPVVSAEWLWECISTGSSVPPSNYIFPEIRDRYPAQSAPGPTEIKEPSQPPNARTDNATQQTRGAAGPASSRPKMVGGFEASAFDKDSHEEQSAVRQNPAPAQGIPRLEVATSADFFTARSQPAGASTKDDDAALTEASCARLNKTPSPSRHTAPVTRTKSDPNPSGFVEEASIPARGPCAPPRRMSSPPRDSRETAAQQDQKKARAAQHQARAAEREALSSRLSSLIDSAAIPGPLDGNCHVQAFPRPRRRQLLGRAISNASNGSSAASVDGSGPPPRQLTDSLRAAMAGVADDDVDHDHDHDHDHDATCKQDTQPPSTQLQYADPEAQQVKAALMNKMMGRDEPAVSAAQTTAVAGARSLRKPTRNGR